MKRQCQITDKNSIYKYSGQYLQIGAKFIFSLEVINWRRDENRLNWKVHLNLQLFTCATYNNLHKATRLEMSEIKIM